MKPLGQETPVIWQQGRKLEQSLATKTLLRMLRNMQQSYPKARLLTRKGGFGVSLEDGRFLYISSSGSWNPMEKRDFLALFATWLVADPNGLEKAPTPHIG
jgi:hypothetical protein